MGLKVKVTETSFHGGIPINGLLSTFYPFFLSLLSYCRNLFHQLK